MSGCVRESACVFGAIKFKCVAIEVSKVLRLALTAAPYARVHLVFFENPLCCPFVCPEA